LKGHGHKKSRDGQNPCGQWSQTPEENQNWRLY
jgi:hypothetical protein